MKTNQSTYGDSYAVALEQVQKLLDRRHTTSGFYLTLNTGVAAVIGVTAKDSGLSGTWLLSSLAILLLGGMVTCWIWNSLVRQYTRQIGWWYTRLREIESGFPDAAQLITREYQDLYLRKDRRRLAISQAEILLTYLFSGIYLVFLVSVLFELAMFSGILR